MYTQTILLAILAAVAEARFGQEQGNGAIEAISALSDLGSPGNAAGLAGGSIQFLLAAANPCGKLTQADSIIEQLGTSDRAIAAARGLVAAEQNFNPFVASIPSVCDDPTLPKTEALRGVVPLIDPAVGGQDVENANSAKSIVTPFDATGLSVAEVMVAQGFSNFTAVALDGTKSPASDSAADPVAAAPAAPAAGNATAPAAPAADDAAAVTSVAAAAPSSTQCGGTTFVTVTKGAATAAASADPAAATTAAAEAPAEATAAPAAGAPGSCTGSGSTLVCVGPAALTGAVSDPVTGTFDGFQASSIAGLDFGLCTPTMKFEESLNNRKAGENTFQAIDPLCNKGQGEALNPNIIANRIKDVVASQCGANQAAKDAAVAAQAMVAALGVKDVTVAEAWNKALGFEGTNTNPDNAPKAGLIGHI